MYNNKNKRPRRTFLTKKFLLLTGLLLIIIIVMFVLELTNTTHIFHKKSVPATIPVSAHHNTSVQSSPTQTKNSASASTINSSQSSAQNAKLPSSGSSSDSSLTLTQPYGDFVSSHTASQNTQELSACDSTPGASCYIQFTNTASGITTKLPVQSIGSDGSTTWPWNTQTLTSGSWKITAVASLGTQTKSATDSIPLEIQ